MHELLVDETAGNDAVVVVADNVDPMDGFNDPINSSTCSKHPRKISCYFFFFFFLRAAVKSKQ